MKRVINDLNLDTNQYEPRTVLGMISNAKNDMLRPKDYAQQADNAFQETVAEIYAAYQAELKRAQSVDFDDLIMLTIDLFQSSPDVLTRYQNQFDYLHVDEYQDTNDAQYTIVNMLAQRSQNLAVVGDADQSIYGWRGANMNNILNFEKDYPNCKSIKLEQNYRSTKIIWMRLMPLLIIMKAVLKRTFGLIKQKGLKFNILQLNLNMKKRLS